MRRAIVCTEDRQGERRISGDCAVPVTELPPALRGTGAEDLEELEVTLGKERDVAAKYYKDHPIEHVETSPNAVEWGPDSDDSEGDPATTDLEMHHTFVQLASGAGKIHKPSVGDEHMPRCAWEPGFKVRGTRRGPQLGHELQALQQVFWKKCRSIHVPLAV